MLLSGMDDSLDADGSISGGTLHTTPPQKSISFNFRFLCVGVPHDVHELIEDHSRLLLCELNRLGVGGVLLKISKDEELLTSLLLQLIALSEGRLPL